MRSIIQTRDDRCFICQMAPGTEWHHLIPGNPQRRYSEEDGLKILLCHDCHERIHSSKGSGELLKLKQLGQIQWEMRYGTDGHEREQFMARYGRNWL